MHSSIEYIFAGIAIFLILSVTSQYATSLVNNSANLIEKEGQTQRADKIIDTLLLSPGSPEQWGLQPDEPTTMGLALQNALKMYELDFDKVSRLNNASMNYISPERVRDLLGLSNYIQISLSISPLLNLTVTQVTDENFSVSVSNQWNMPVSNVNITGAYCDTSIENLTEDNITSFMDYNLDSSYAWNVTNAFGTCTLSFAGSGSRPSMIVLASSLNVQCLTTWPSQTRLVISTVDSLMGSGSSLYNTEVVQRTVDIGGFSYLAKLTVWGEE